MVKYRSRGDNIGSNFKPFDDSKYPDWLFKKSGNANIASIVESDDEERALKQRSPLAKGAEIDAQLAEQRAKTIVK